MLKLRCEKVEPRSETEFDITFSFADQTEIYEVTRHGPFTVKVADATGYTAGSEYQIAPELVAPPEEETPVVTEEEEVTAHGPKRRHR